MHCKTHFVTLSLWLAAEVKREKQRAVCCQFSKERNPVREQRLVSAVLWRKQMRFIVWNGFTTAEIIFKSELEMGGGTEGGTKRLQ